jgi:hypothetical protein
VVDAQRCGGLTVLVGFNDIFCIRSLLFPDQPHPSLPGLFLDRGGHRCLWHGEGSAGAGREAGTASARLGGCGASRIRLGHHGSDRGSDGPRLSVSVGNHRGLLLHIVLHRIKHRLSGPVRALPHDAP